MSDSVTTRLHRAPLSQQTRRVVTTTSPDAIGATVTVNIDGIEAKVPFGSTILQAAESIGIHIPTLCNHPDLDVAGICRICVVEVEGQRLLQPACAFPVTNQMTIDTHSRRVRLARRHVLELLLSEHYGECYSCQRNGNCELQALAEEYGITEFRFGHPDAAGGRGRRLELLGRARHEQVHPLPALRAHLHRPAGGRRPRGREPQRPGRDHDLRRPSAGRGRLHQLRAVHQPLPHRRALRQRRDRRGLGGHRRPRQARRHPDRPGAALGDGRVLRPRAGHRRHLPDEHRPAAGRLRQGVRHQLHGRPDHHRRGHRAAPPPLQGARRKGRDGRPAAVHELLAGLGQVPRALLPRVPAQRLVGQEPAADVRRAHQDLLRREAGLRPGQHRERRAHAVLGQEVRVQPARDARLRLQGRRLRPHHA